MSDWLLLALPLLALPIVLLFRFVGCGDLLAGRTHTVKLTLAPDATIIRRGGTTKIIALMEREWANGPITVAAGSIAGSGLAPVPGLTFGFAPPSVSWDPNRWRTSPSIS